LHSFGSDYNYTLILGDSCGALLYETLCVKRSYALGFTLSVSLLSENQKQLTPQQECDRSIL
ncbi:MAG: hypothetical protein ACYT04_92120, partial [Nostoc sp.]